MATTPNKLTADERKLILEALETERKSCERAMKAAKTLAIENAYKEQARLLENLQYKIDNAQLDL